MAITVAAIYEDGVLKLSEPLPLKEHERVEIHVQPKRSSILDAYGILNWKGDTATLERIALDQEFLPEEEE